MRSCLSLWYGADDEGDVCAAFEIEFRVETFELRVQVRRVVFHDFVLLGYAVVVGADEF